MPFFKITISMQTYRGQDWVAHPYPEGEPYVGSVVLEADTEHKVRSDAFEKYINYPGAIGTILKVKELR